MGEHGTIVELILQVERWGAAVFLLQDDYDGYSSSSSSSSCGTRFLSWLGAMVLLAIMILGIWCRILLVNNNSNDTWGSFVLDTAVTLISLVLVLQSPVECALQDLSFGVLFLRSDDDEQEEPVAAGDAAEESNSESAPQGENTLLIVGDIEPHPWQKDSAIRFLAFSFLLCSLLFSCIRQVDTSGVLASQCDTTIVAVVQLLSSILWNVVYCAGYFWMGVSCRVLALRVQQLGDCLREFKQGGVDLDMWMLQQVRQGYEDTVEAALVVTQRTSRCTLLLVVLALIQMISLTFQECIFIATKSYHGHDENPVITMVRLILLLILHTVLVYQVVLASANVLLASHHLAEIMAQLECRVRQDLVQDSIYEDMANARPSIAELLRAIGYRVSSFPVRGVAMGWFQCNIPWTTGIVLFTLGLLFVVVVVTSLS